MARSPRPPTPFEQRLAAGLVHRAVPIVRGLPSQGQRVAALMAQLGGLTLGEASRLAGMGIRAVRAGEALAGLAGSETLAMGQIPVNPWLFGGDPQGRKYEYRVFITYTAPGETRPRPFLAFVDSGRLLSKNELLAAAYDQFVEQSSSTDPFDPSQVPTLADLQYHIEAIQRKF